MRSSEPDLQAPVATRRRSSGRGLHRRHAPLWCLLLPVALAALTVGVVRVDANAEREVPPRTSVLSADVMDLAVGKVVTPGRSQVRKFAAVPVPKPPAENAVPLHGALHPRVRAAYQHAQRIAASRWPRCGLRWTILAAIGAVESAHGAQHEGAVVLEDSGTILPPIFGPPLDGKGGRGSVPDSDGGGLDGDASYDRAVGPMQMIPSSWQRHAQDANGDGAFDPQSIDDAAAAAASYLCAAAGGNLRDVEALDRAIFSYNHSEQYVLSVRTQLERLDRAFGFGAMAPLVTEPPPPEPVPAEDPPVTSPAPEPPPSTTAESPTSSTAVP